MMKHKVPPHAYTYTASFALAAASNFIEDNNIRTATQAAAVLCLAHAVYDTISGGYVQRFPAFVSHLAHSFWNKVSGNTEANEAAPAAALSAN